MHMRSLRLVLPVCLIALLAGCGQTPQVRHNARQKTIGGHVCTPADEALQCILPPAPRQLNLTTRSVVHGVDFAWGAPSVAGMHSLGARLGASYFSYDRS